MANRFLWASGPVNRSQHLLLPQTLSCEAQCGRRTWQSGPYSSAWNVESSRRARAIPRGWAVAPKDAKCSCRFSWLTETNAEPLQPWEVTKTSSSLREQLPLQKTLVPTRSVPVRG
ncbi:hypothetical protein EI555_019715 [Monodon monoceros]|uniref:Uncharacterized protein n=1 Tax=Monodon monoceros TaxID=40151 RepID=A0A4U1F8I2_MONMO|nr:hypothetical protein EI555_019715 [Monodon monoceros]